MLTAVRMKNSCQQYRILYVPHTVLKVQLKPFGLKFSVCKVVALNRHSVNKRLTHYIITLEIDGTKITIITDIY